MAPANPLSRAVSTTAFRLAAVTVAAYLICAGLIVGLLFWQTNRILTNQVLLTLHSEAQLLEAVAQAGGLPALARAVEARSQPDGLGLYYLASSADAKIAGNLSRLPPEIASSEAGGVFRYTKGGKAGENARLGVAIPVALKGGARLIVGRDIEEQRHFADEMGRVFLIGFGLLSLAGLAGGFVISRIVLKRIEAINVASRSIMHGDLSKRVALSGSGDELDDLAINLNAMLDRIEALMNGLREVSDNIAHDLKTPLNRLRNSAEAALRDPTGEEACRRGLENTIEEADELIKTFNGLLLIARLEAGALEDSAERFDLGGVVRDVAELYEPVAEERQLKLEIDATDGPVVTANRQLVGQAVANLIDNAIKYSAHVAEAHNTSSEINVSVTTLDEGIEISVADRGPGIASSDRDRVLRRFVRLEKSRTESGTGLGLSLVQAVARLHGGSVRLEDNEPGLRVVLTLPRRLAE
jgi:signal transduction histidine kinase